MNANMKVTEMKDRKIILSTLWIFAMLNYLYADVFSVYFNPEAQQQAQEFTAGSPGVILVFAVLMETAMAMVLLSRILGYRANRWTNVVVAVLHTASVTWTLIDSKPELFYAFFAAIEIACTLFIIWYAWSWKREAAATPEALPATLQAGPSQIEVGGD